MCMQFVSTCIGSFIWNAVEDKINDYRFTIEIDFEIELFIDFKFDFLIEFFNPFSYRIFNRFRDQLSYGVFVKPDTISPRALIDFGL